MGLAITSTRLAFVALGSNLGDSEKLLREAMVRLEGFSDQPLMKSSLWRTAPVNCPPGSPHFVNAVVGMQPRRGETPERLLTNLQALEREFGRRPKKVQNEPRPLDLDIITFGSEIRTSPTLTLPHPRAHQRRFVLQPLAEIEPQLILPGQTQTIAELLGHLQTGEQIERLGD